MRKLNHDSAEKTSDFFNSLLVPRRLSRRRIDPLLPAGSVGLEDITSAGRRESGARPLPLLHCRCHQAGALIPLKLALRQLQRDERGGTERLAVADEMLEALVVGMLVDALDRGVDDAERENWQIWSRENQRVMPALGPLAVF